MIELMFAQFLRGVKGRAANVTNEIFDAGVRDFVTIQAVLAEELLGALGAVEPHAFVVFLLVRAQITRNRKTHRANVTLELLHILVDSFVGLEGVLCHETFTCTHFFIHFTLVTFLGYSYN